MEDKNNIYAMMVIYEYVWNNSLSFNVSRFLSTCLLIIVDQKTQTYWSMSKPQYQKAT